MGDVDVNINWPILIGVVGYNLVVIAVMNIYLYAKKRKENLKEDFAFAGGNLPFYVVGATAALTILGGGHIMGVTGQSQITGIATYLYPVAHAFCLFITLYVYGPWVRRMGFQTVGQALSCMWSPAVRPLLIGGTVACCFGILTLECQGLGSIISVLTGLEVWQGCIIGAAIGFVYVIIAGMKEVGWVNVANSLMMYIVCAIALIVLGVRMAGGWTAVNDYYINTGSENLLRIFGDTDIVKNYVVGAMLSVIFGTTLTQATVQNAISAKHIKECRKALMVAIPANVLFGIIAVSMGMASKAMGYGENMGGIPVFNMCIDLLPPVLCFLVLGVFLAAILSTFAMMSLGMATCLTFDIQKAYFWKESSTEKESRWVRIWIAILAVVTCYVAAYVPSVSDGITWCVSWMVPLAISVFIGLFYKRSNVGVIVTIIVCWIFNFIFSLTTVLTDLGIGVNNYSGCMIVITLVLGLITATVDRKAKPSMFSVYMKQRSQYNAKRGISASVK